MSFKTLPIDQRIKSGIRDFDYKARVNKAPTNWRSQVDLKSVRFSPFSLNDSFPAKVYGSMGQAWKTDSINYTVNLSNHGYIADKFISATALRIGWENTLKTDKEWVSAHGVYHRTIRGAIIHIVKENEVFVVYLTRSAWTDRLGGKYKSVQSAKRGVRKMSNLI